MKVVVQRVLSAEVCISGKVFNQINNGFVLLLGVSINDTQEDALWLCNKISQLRIFSDEQGLMNLSIKDVKGEILSISQFTLIASYKKGNRPSFIEAARPEKAIELYNFFNESLKNTLGANSIKTGVFGADMQVKLVNNGPVTICMDTNYKE